MNIEALLGQSGIDLGALAKQVGLSPDQLKLGGESILGQLAGGGNAGDAAESVSAQTGLDLSKLQALLPVLLPLVMQHLGSLGGSAQGGQSGGAGGLLGQLGGLLDRDGDGSALDDIAGMAGGFFKK